MRNLRLTICTRKGCCLCEGLERRLRAISLDEINQSIELCVLDIDDVNTPEQLRLRYDLEVPVLLISLNESKESIELPRVSPRIKGESLALWLQKEINKIIQIV